MTNQRPDVIFVDLPNLGILDYAHELGERGWRMEHDETMEFGFLCFPPDADACSSGWKLRHAAVFQAERDLIRHFDFLFASLYEVPPPLPHQEDPDAEHPVGQPG